MLGHMMQRIKEGAIQIAKKAWLAFWPSAEEAPVVRPRPRWFLLSVIGISDDGKREDVTERYEELCCTGDPWWGEFFEAAKLELTYAHVSGKCYTLFLEPGFCLAFPKALDEAYKDWDGKEKENQFFAYVQYPDGTRSSVTFGARRFLGPLGDLHASLGLPVPSVDDVIRSLDIPPTVSKLVVYSNEYLPFEHDMTADDASRAFLKSHRTVES